MEIAIKYHIFIFFLWFSLGQSAFAQVSKTQIDTEQRIEILRHDSSVSPKEVLKELNLLMPLIEDNQWHESMLKLVALKIETQLRLEQFNEADELINEFLPIAKQANLPLVTLRYELSKLEVADVRGISDESTELREYLLAKTEKIEGNSLDVASAYMKIGHSERFESNITKALKFYKKAYELYLASSDELAVSDVLNSLANVYLDLNDIDKAKEFFKKTLIIDRANNDKLSESIVLYNLGRAYLLNEEYQEAKKAFNESLQLSISLDDEVGVQWAQLSLADVSIRNKQWQQALNYYNETVNVFRNNGDTRMYFDSLAGITKAHIGLKNLIEAEEYLNLAHELLGELNDKNFDSDYLNILALLAFAKGDYLTAYETQKAYSNQKNIYYKEQQKQDLQKYRVQFDSELKENENKVLSKQNELNNLKIAKQQQQKEYSYLIIALALTVILIVAFALYKQIQHRNRFKAMALRDHLTNSPNRRAILQYAKERFNEAEQTEMELCVGIIDLDFFKKVNDTFGHDVGDEVLKSFALACKTVVRKQDRYGRYGGEEWLIVLSDTNKDHIQAIFDRLHQELNNSLIANLPPEHRITFSMGVAQYKHKQDTSLQALIIRADNCLYKAKDTGRNKLVIDVS
jgi:diguanylate cyclase (GGDEF)-like protein